MEQKMAVYQTIQNYMFIIQCRAVTSKKRTTLTPSATGSQHCRQQFSKATGLAEPTQTSSPQSQPQVSQLSPPPTSPLPTHLQPEP